jgi:hypothetical protein
VTQSKAQRSSPRGCSDAKPKRKTALLVAALAFLLPTRPTELDAYQIASPHGDGKGLVCVQQDSAMEEWCLCKKDQNAKDVRRKRKTAVNIFIVCILLCIIMAVNRTNSK